MSKDVFHKWEARFRRDAAADGMALLRDHLEYLVLPGEPEKLLEGTIMFTRASCAYLNIDACPIDQFLSLQTLQADCRCRLKLCLHFLSVRPYLRTSHLPDSGKAH